MKTFSKYLLYIIFIVVFYLLSLYKTPSIWDKVDNKIWSTLNKDIKQKTDNFINILLQESESIDEKIETLAPKTKNGINQRIWNAERINNEKAIK